MKRAPRTSLLTVTLIASIGACQSSTPDAQPKPSGATMPTDTPTPHAPTASASAGADAAPTSLPDADSDDSPPLPSAEEQAETPLEAYVSIVPEPTMASVLPCPPGTTQNVGENVIECRIAGRPGETMSKRQGPSLWFHPNGKVRRAGSYDNHDWTGRWWDFDDQGRLEVELRLHRWQRGGPPRHLLSGRQTALRKLL